MRFAILALVVMGMPLMLADLHERSKLTIQAVLEALTAAQLTQKDAYLAMGIDKHAWSRMLTGELQLSLTRLARLPLAFQIEFLARYAFLVVRDAAREIAADVQSGKRSA